MRLDLSPLDEIVVPDRWPEIERRAAVDVIRRSPRARRPWWPAAIAAAAAIVFVAGFVLLTADGPTVTDGRVADAPLVDEPTVEEPGSVTDPLVFGTVGPEPRFDTSTYGPEVVVDQGDLTAEEIEALLDPDRFDGQRIDAVVRRVTVIGRVDGVVWAIKVTDGTGFADAWEGQNVRTRMVVELFRGASGGGEPVDPSSGLFLDFGLEEQEPTIAFNTGPQGSVVFDHLPEATSVVTYADSNGLTRWVRPVAGVAIVPTHVEPGDRFTLQAFDVTGASLAVERVTVPSG